MTNSADPVQLASESGSTLFAKTGHIRIQQGQGYGLEMLGRFSSILYKGEFPQAKLHLKWIHFSTSLLQGDQEVAGSTPAEVGNILSWRLITKYFLRSFSPFR